MSDASDYLAYIKDWRNKVLTPLAGAQGYLSPDYDRTSMLLDLFDSSDEPRHEVPEIAHYYANFAFVLADGVASYRDSSGATRAFPEGIARVESLRIEAVRHRAFRGSDEKENRIWLMFRGADGRVLLLLPGYGWDFENQLSYFATQCSWDHDLSVDPSRTIRTFLRDLGSTYPGIASCPRADIGQPLSDGDRR